MKNCTLLTDGDKLKNIRKKYGLKQEEISGSAITRNLISEIETNKATITKNTAEIIIKNLAVLAKERHFQFTETVEYLLENETMQANKIVNDYINELKTLNISKDGNFTTKLKEIESFLLKYDIPDKKIIIYELAGDYYCNKNEMSKSVIYYEKAITLTGKLTLSNTSLTLLRKLSMVYGYLGRYKESIECCEFALNNFTNMSNEMLITFRYNNALNYYNLKNYIIALNNLRIAEKLVSTSNKESYFLIQNNLGGYLFDMGHYTEALDVFTALISYLDKNITDKYVMTLLNVVNACLSLSKQYEALENFNIALNELKNLNNTPYMADIYYEIGKIYKRLNKIDLSESYCLNAVNFAENDKNYVLLSKILCDLIDIYSNSHNIKKMEYVKNKVLSITHLQGYFSNLLVYKLFIFYVDHNKETAKNIANFALNFEKEA